METRLIAKITQAITDKLIHSNISHSAEFYYDSAFSDVIDDEDDISEEEADELYDKLYYEINFDEIEESLEDRDERDY